MRVRVCVCVRACVQVCVCVCVCVYIYISGTCLRYTSRAGREQGGNLAEASAEGLEARQLHRLALPRPGRQRGAARGVSEGRGEVRLLAGP